MLNQPVWVGSSVIVGQPETCDNPQALGPEGEVDDSLGDAHEIRFAMRTNDMHLDVGRADGGTGLGGREYQNLEQNRKK